MGQCCGKCKESQEEGGGTGEEGGREVRQPSITPLLAAESNQSAAESSQPQDEYVSAQKHDEPTTGSESPSLALSTPDAGPDISCPMDQHLNYPIFKDKDTINYVLKSKVMVIMKGLQGSGKSFICSKLKQMYSKAVVCSADFYFMKDGEYKFNADKLKLAHDECYQSAKQAAISGAPMIIIDNTNIQAWNYRNYVNLSKCHHYTPLIIEPQTPWAKDPKQLAIKNTHGITQEQLEKRLVKYEPPLPLFYWWFLNEQDSSQIISMAQDWLKKSLQVQEFFKDFCKFSKLSSTEDLLRYYKKNEGPGDYKVLHATACVTRKGKAKNAIEYMAKTAVKESLGKSFTLHIIGYVITPRTFGIRVRLGEEALEVWGMDDEETESEDTLSNTEGKDPRKTSQQPDKESERVSLGDTSLRMGSCQSTLRTGESQLHNARFHPTVGRGSRAHLTLGCAPHIPAKITGFDMMKVVSCEQRIVKNKNPEELDGIFKTFSIPEGELRTLGDSIWVVYPEKEIHVSSIFSGFY